MDNLLNKKYLELEVLTPLHVGAGSEKDWMKGADFIQDNNQVYILNHRRLLSKMTADELSGFLVKKDDGGLKGKISGSLEDVSDMIFDMPASTDNDIKVFIKNGLTNKPIVPGSSIKGAIRSIILEYLFLPEQRHGKLDEKEIFGSSTRGDEFMRFIKISDADFEKTDLVNTKIFNLYGTASNLNGGWKHSGGRYGKTTSEFKPVGFNTVYEVLKPNETGELSIALSDRAFENFYKKNKKENKPEKKSAILDKKPSEKLFAIINEHTKKYIDKQIAFFEKYSTNETNKIIASLKDVKNQIPVDNSFCVLQMSAGSGFHSITGDWQFDDFSINQIDAHKRNRGKLNGKPSAKSRKIAIDNGNFYLMGFVKLSILDAETIARREAEKQASSEAKRKAEQEQISKAKAEKERIEAEKQAKLEADQKAEKERMQKEQEKKEKLEALLKQHEEEDKQRREANKAKREKEQKSIMEKGLKDLINFNDFNKGKKIIEPYFKSLEGKLIEDETQVKILKDFISRCIQKSNKRWKKEGDKDWKLVIKWTGKEPAQQWFNEMKK